MPELTPSASVVSVRSPSSVRSFSSRLTARAVAGSSGCTNCASLTFTYNDASNVVSKTSTITGATNGTTTFSYDAIDRLTGYTPPSAIQPQIYAWNYQPDRSSIKTGTAPAILMTFDAASRPVSDSNGTYSNDYEGRLTLTPTRSMEYDALGRLVTVRAQPGSTLLATYTYDSLDRLRTITEGGVTTRLRYVGLSTAVAVKTFSPGLKSPLATPNRFPTWKSNSSTHFGSPRSSPARFNIPTKRPDRSTALRLN